MSSRTLVADTTSWRLAKSPHVKSPAVAFVPVCRFVAAAAPSTFRISIPGYGQQRRIIPRCSMADQQLAAAAAEVSAQATSTVRGLTPLSDVFDFICKGPLLPKMGFNRETVAAEFNEWISLGLRLSRILGFSELFLSDAEKARIYHYYIPVYMWCKKELDEHRSQFKEGDTVPAIVIGISAPQGCGKTTLVDSLEYLFNSSGRTAASVSIDDFYLTASEQSELAAKFQGNSLLELRGNAGSHDLRLGTETIQCLRNLAPGETAKVPHYEKSANNGRGDRADPATWSKVTGPVEVVLFEGWMLGFTPQDPKSVASIDPQLDVVNSNLEAYQEAWFSLVNSWIVIQVQDPEWVYAWRLEAELAMKAEGKPGMTDEQVSDFVARYIPAYKAYLPSLYGDGPANARPGHVLQLAIDKSRNPC